MHRNLQSEIRLGILISHKKLPFMSCSSHIKNESHAEFSSQGDLFTQLEFHNLQVYLPSLDRDHSSTAAETHCTYITHQIVCD